MFGRTKSERLGLRKLYDQVGTGISSHISYIAFLSLHVHPIISTINIPDYIIILSSPAVPSSGSPSSPVSDPMATYGLLGFKLRFLILLGVYGDDIAVDFRIY